MEAPWQNLIVMAGPLWFLSPKIFAAWLFVHWLLSELYELLVTQGRAVLILLMAEALRLSMVPGIWWKLNKYLLLNESKPQFPQLLVLSRSLS